MAPPVTFDTNAIELTWLILLVPVIAWGVATRNSRCRASAVERVFARFAGKRRLAVVSVGVLVLALRAALLPLHPVPQPAVFEDFSYLLAADTFASGRIANPSHPLWTCFENSMIVSQPTYVSKYPPAQGLVLAAGILLARNPWVGVWLSAGVMCAAIVWMLQAWVPPRWALLGGLLAMLRTVVGSYWIDSYFGGTVAAIGGALLYGSLPRLMRRRLFRDGLIFGIGLAVLANSRPYEGLLAAAPAVLILAAWAYRRRRAALRPLLPILVLLLLTSVWILVYNFKTTGQPLVMPYQVHEAQYANTPLFWFQKLGPDRVYPHEVMKVMWTDARKVYFENLSVGLFWASLQKVGKLGNFFLGPLLAVCLLALPWELRAKRLRLAYLVLGVVLVGLLLEIGVFPHYAAPVTGIIYLLTIQCLRRVRASGRIGLVVGRAIPVLLVAMLIAFYGAEAAGGRFLHEVFSWCFARPGLLTRARIQDRLNHSEGQHLVLVRYDPKSTDSYAQWVFNRADIDSAKVVWAWDDEAGCSGPLIRYFPSRHVWLLEADSPNPDLKPYPADP
ncbi:MAG: hypothetical protein LAQ69_13350 [Acidobacteriia bacterium]|nr:hypothetical protein [Terriglobia bacterium]